MKVDCGITICPRVKGELVAEREQDNHGRAGAAVVLEEAVGIPIRT